METLDPTHLRIGTPKKSDVAEIVNAYCEARGIATRLKSGKELQARFPYPRMAARTKRLLEDCGGTLTDAILTVTTRNYFL